MIHKYAATLTAAIWLASTFAAPAAGPTVSGKAAVLRRGVARAPSKAPLPVKEAIWAVNTLLRKPYRWGGGHATFDDAGYDCSGTVSYLLHSAGVLDEPTTSKALQTWGEPGPGKWITVYAKSGHTFAIVCGLRLDTTGHRRDEGPRWRNWPRKLQMFTARHPLDL